MEAVELREVLRAVFRDMRKTMRTRIGEIVPEDEVVAIEQECWERSQTLDEYLCEDQHALRARVFGVRDELVMRAIAMGAEGGEEAEAEAKAICDAVFGGQEMQWVDRDQEREMQRERLVQTEHDIAFYHNTTLDEAMAFPGLPMDDSDYRFDEYDPSRPASPMYWPPQQMQCEIDAPSKCTEAEAAVRECKQCPRRPAFKLGSSVGNPIDLTMEDSDEEDL